MPRSIWSGAISFGLVNVPIKLYSAVSRKTVRFHQLNSETGVRIQQRRVDPSTEEEVPYENLVKGYELTKDRYVVIEPEELESLDPVKTKTIDIEDFVDLADIDPIYYDSAYYLVPDKGAAKAYGLLLGAMNQSEKVAIARFVLRTKEQLVAVRPKENLLVLNTLLYADEVTSPDELDGLPAAEELKASARELKMAEQLIQSLSTEWRPEGYTDEYRDKVLELVEKKAAGESIAVQPEAEEPAKVPDLMAALEASLAAAKSGSDGNAKDDGKKAAGGGKKKKETAKTASGPGPLERVQRLLAGGEDDCCRRRRPRGATPARAVAARGLAGRMRSVPVRRRCRRRPSATGTNRPGTSRRRPPRRRRSQRGSAAHTARSRRGRPCRPGEHAYRRSDRDGDHQPGDRQPAQPAAAAREPVGEVVGDDKDDEEHGRLDGRRAHAGRADGEDHGDREPEAAEADERRDPSGGEVAALRQHAARDANYGRSRDSRPTLGNVIGHRAAG